MNLGVFVQSVSNGIALGTMYALLAVGFTVIYGILQFINFAHSEVFMVASYIPAVALTWLLLPWPAGFALTIVLTAALGAGIDRVAYLRLRKAPKLSCLVAAIGVSFFLQNFVLLVFGGAPKRFAVPAMLAGSSVVAGIYIPTSTFVALAVTAVSFAILYFITYRTKTGLALRAVSEDPDAAGLMGINPNRTVAVAFALGSGLAAVGALAWCLRYPVTRPTMGTMPGTKAFVASVLGGVGNINGAILGGLLLGLGELVFVAVFPQLTSYRDVFAFIVLLIVLVGKPTGLLGASIREQKM